MEDPYLASVVRYVEGGGEPVKVSMALTSGVVVTGFVRRAAFFASFSGQQAQDQYVRETTLIRQRGETSKDAVPGKTPKRRRMPTASRACSTTPTGRLPKRSRCRT
jgi:hypothetical protein